MRRRGELHRRRAQQEIGRAGQQREHRRAPQRQPAQPDPPQHRAQHQPGEAGAQQHQVGDREAVRQAMAGGDEIAAQQQHGEHAGGDGTAVGVGLVGHRPQHAGDGGVVLGSADERLGRQLRPPPHPFQLFAERRRHQGGEAGDAGQGCRHAGGGADRQRQPLRRAGIRARLLGQGHPADHGLPALPLPHRQRRPAGGRAAAARPDRGPGDGCARPRQPAAVVLARLPRQRRLRPALPEALDARGACGRAVPADRRHLRPDRAAAGGRPPCPGRGPAAPPGRRLPGPDRGRAAPPRPARSSGRSSRRCWPWPTSSACRSSPPTTSTSPRRDA